uniref:Uncharacterized protein n=1 Tax=Branchiostoma floridae TaxID=7739 RepID=C3ZB06_BRAFL|eukprot:XP_002594032.1 hypothetical protein BRAFLDRAFT_68528 [Branchiostoma floridae]
MDKVEEVLGRVMKKHKLTIAPDMLQEFKDYVTPCLREKCFSAVHIYKEEPHRHLVFAGPPGLKASTTLAVLANERANQGDREESRNVGDGARPVEAEAVETVTDEAGEGAGNDELGEGGLRVQQGVGEYMLLRTCKVSCHIRSCISTIFGIEIFKLNFPGWFEIH